MSQKHDAKVSANSVEGPSLFKQSKLSLKKKHLKNTYFELTSSDDGSLIHEGFNDDESLDSYNNDKGDEIAADYEQHLPGNTGTSSISGAVLNFTNSIVGAGIIGLPYALNQAGLGFGILIMTSLAFLVDWTVRLLVRTSKLAGVSTYQDLVEFCFGRKGLIAISVFQFLFAFGAMCAYSVIVGDTVPLVLQKMLGDDLSPAMQFLTSRRFIIILTTLGVSLPLSLYRDISKLAKASAFAMVALVFILIVVMIQGPLDSNKSPPLLDFMHPNFLQSVGVISFAFVCHHNSFLIFSSLVKPSLNRWEIVTHLSTGISWMLSIAMALAGYLAFGYKTEGNILNNFSNDNFWVNLARLAFAANMFTTFPLECFVCREVIEHFYYPGQTISYKLHVILTTGLTVVALIIALSTCDLGVVLELTGCFSATALAYILPSCCYLKLSSGPTFTWKKAPAILCLIFGIFIMFFSTSMALYAAFNENKRKDCHW
ncbi:hypothetical protein MP638_005120 [Amoeboaphelidium occidentale]|nr:hypothetical protein MP638_005120 [Amoeboaphelidium occidentale]